MESDLDDFDKDLQLLKIGEKYCSSDYAVTNFLLPFHPKFFGHVELLIKAIRRQAENSPKKIREEINEELTDIGYKNISTKQPIISPICDYINQNEKNIKEIISSKTDEEIINILNFMKNNFNGENYEDINYWFEEIGIEIEEETNELIEKDGIIKTFKNKIQNHYHFYQFALNLFNSFSTEPIYNKQHMPLYYKNIAIWLKDQTFKKNEEE
ncbi:MAG: hypothetical protein QXH07_05480 [Thermoplasmata archaeon]